MKIVVRFQIGLNSNLKMPHKRKNQSSNNSTCLNIDKRIESLNPMDTWLYKYAKRLLNARWKWFKTGIYLAPTHPPYPGKASSAHYKSNIYR